MNIRQSIKKYPSRPPSVQLSLEELGFPNTSSLSSILPVSYSSIQADADQDSIQALLDHVRVVIHDEQDDEQGAIEALLNQVRNVLGDSKDDSKIFISNNNSMEELSQDTIQCRCAEDKHVIDSLFNSFGSQRGESIMDTVMHSHSIQSSRSISAIKSHSVPSNSQSSNCCQEIQRNHEIKKNLTPHGVQRNSFDRQDQRTKISQEFQMESMSQERQNIKNHREVYIKKSERDFERTNIDQEIQRRLETRKLNEIRQRQEAQEWEREHQELIERRDRRMESRSRIGYLGNEGRHEDKERASSNQNILMDSSLNNGRNENIIQDYNGGGRDDNNSTINRSASPKHPPSRPIPKASLFAPSKPLPHLLSIPKIEYESFISEADVTIDVCLF